MTAEETIKSFVEASLSVEDFEKKIYSNKAIELLLKDEKKPSRLYCRT